MKKKILAFTLALLLVLPLGMSWGHARGAPTFWFDTNWLRRTSVITDSGDVDTAITNFPVLVYLNSSRIDWTLVKDDLSDIRFVSQNGLTIYDHEIESYSINNEAWFWVCLPSINNITDTPFYFYYGNTVASSIENKTAVWDNNFVMIQHLVDNSTSTVLDSTQYDNDGIKFEANGPREVPNGTIDSAQQYDGVNDLIQVADDPTIEGMAELTISIWEYIEEPIHTFPTLVYKPSVYRLYYSNGSTQIGFRVWNTTADISTWGCWVTVNKGEWIYTTVTYNGTYLSMYKNGLFARGVTWNGSTLGSGADAVTIGSEASNKWWKGTIDEVRMSNKARSEGWIKTSYESERDDFLTYGYEEELGREQSWGGSLILALLICIPIILLLLKGSRR